MIPLHGIGGRGDLPVPLWLALRALGLVALALLLGAAWFGSTSSALNPAPTWLYVWIWVGIIPVSLLLGPVWRLANPLRTLASFVPRRVVRPLPAGIAYWPVVAGLLGFVWLELAYPEASDPLVVAVFVSAYCLVNVAADIVYGPRWFSVGDSFEVYAEVLARLSPLGRVDGQLVLRNPLAGLATMPREPGLVGPLCLFLGPILLIAAFVRIARRKEAGVEDDDWDADLGDLPGERSTSR